VESPRGNRSLPGFSSPRAELLRRIDDGFALSAQMVE
jgi:hypothetical protein